MGGSSGIGLGIAKGLANKNYNLTIVSRDKSKLEKAKNELFNISQNQNTFSFQADITKSNDIVESIKFANDKMGSIDILINNGGGPKFSTFDKLTDEDWDHSIDLVLKSAIKATSLVSENMIRKKWGRIITITSTLAKEPSEGMVLSATTRAGVTAFMKAISNQLIKFGITVNVVSPGGVLTDRINELINQQASNSDKTYDDILKLSNESIPLGKLASTEEFANYVLFLCSEESNYITGTVLNVDGGLSKSIF